MTRSRFLSLALLIAGGVAIAAAPALAEAPPAKARPASLFDPARHMRISEVKPGMKGYGLSVFSGTKIEKFDVEVVSVLKNFNPKYDVVLINCKGQNLEHTGAIAGMSGSPVFLKDDQGRDRMIGAFAYGWPLTKDPMAGVQPIEYMLTLPLEKPQKSDDKDGNKDKSGKGIAGHAEGDSAAGGGAKPRAAWSWGDGVASWDRLTRPA